MTDINGIISRPMVTNLRQVSFTKRSRIVFVVEGLGYGVVIKAHSLLLQFLRNVSHFEMNNLLSD
jgi:hypothetical protein